MFEQIGVDRLVLDDFRTNGMLLPAREEAVQRLALPLHRGPHRDYNAMVIERVGQIETHWSQTHCRNPVEAGDVALMRLLLLQRALRRRLLCERQPLRLNNKDPLGSGYDFSDLDAMAEELWRSS